MNTADCVQDSMTESEAASRGKGLQVSNLQPFSRMIRIVPWVLCLLAGVVCCYCAGGTLLFQQSQ